MIEKTSVEYSCPTISNPPQETQRLIDTGLLHFEASLAGYNERYRHGETSHTIHVWWARRPHSAMRPLIFASVCKNRTESALDIMADLAISNEKECLEKAKGMLLECYEETPKVLDMFGGGGTIPFEAKRLGLDTYSIDSNQLSVFIQKCNMLYADRINLDLAIEQIEKIGNSILYNLKSRTEWMYPLREKNVFGYLWTYQITCPHCGKKYHLSKRYWLSKKNGKNIALVPTVLDLYGNETLVIKNLDNGELSHQSNWEKNRGILHCPHCHNFQESIDVLQCDDVIVALIKKDAKPGKEYLSPSDMISIPDDETLKHEEEKLLKKIGTKIPSSELPQWSGIVNPSLYGINTHGDFLNQRQRLLLLYLIDELLMQYIDLSKNNEELAKFVIGTLSSLIDQVIDWNCRLSMWIPQNEQVGRAFCGPGVAMLFDYVETDQLMTGPANLWAKLQRIINGVKSFENCKGSITIQHAHAQELPFADNYFDAIITDPPYYDNIYYSILADFFYSWKKIILEKIEPEIFSTKVTDYNFELVASSRRVEKSQSAHEEYCKQLCQVFNEASRVLKKDGIFSFIYSHSSLNGWEAIIRAYRQSDFIINSVQPLSIERKSRPRAVLSQAVNTCVTIISRKTEIKKDPISISLVLDKTHEYCATFGQKLIELSGWSQSDAGLAVLSSIVGLLANTSIVEGIDSDSKALLEVSKVVKNYFPEFKLKIRDSL